MAKTKTWAYIDMPGIKKESYRIYLSGKVYSEKTKKWLTPIKNNKGYKAIYLMNTKGETKQFFIHRLMAYAFIPRTEIDDIHERDFVHFIDFNKRNISIDNLQFTNQVELYVKTYIHTHPDEFSVARDYTKFIQILARNGYATNEIIDILDLPNTKYTRYSVVSKIVSECK